MPPPPDEIGALLDDLERFIHEPATVPPLIEAALVHYQFETIHPFPDGNGRLGRLLIVFLLIARERLPAPLLYLSPYFEARRDDYYAALQGVRERGDIDGWLALFLDAVHTQATDAVVRAERLHDLREDFHALVRAATRGVANEAVDLVLEQPVLTAAIVERRLGISRPASLSTLRLLQRVGVLEDASSGPKGLLQWHAPRVLSVLTAEWPVGQGIRPPKTGRRRRAGGPRAASIRTVQAMLDEDRGDD